MNSVTLPLHIDNYSLGILEDVEEPLVWVHKGLAVGGLVYTWRLYLRVGLPVLL